MFYKMRDDVNPAVSSEGSVSQWWKSDRFSLSGIRRPVDLPDHKMLERAEPGKRVETMSPVANGIIVF